MQEIRIEGYVGQDPQTKNTNGRDYTFFSVGCSAKTGRKDNNGNEIYATTWYTVYCKPEECTGILKGTRVMVTGMPKYSYYADRNGMTQISITIAFPKIYISTYISKNEDNPNRPLRTKEQQEELMGKRPQGSSTEQQQQPATIEQIQPTEEDDGLPF